MYAPLHLVVRPNSESKQVQLETELRTMKISAWSRWRVGGGILGHRPGYAVRQRNHLCFKFAARARFRPVLRTFNDAVVAFRAGAECLKRLLVSLTSVSRQRDVIAVEFDNDSPLRQPCFLGLNLARGPG